MKIALITLAVILLAVVVYAGFAFYVFMTEPEKEEYDINRD